jgi:hypothetical protein
MFTSARSSKVLHTTATLVLALAGLATQAARADNLNPILGGGLGAMAGALIGQSMGGRNGAMVGAAVGGMAGVGIASNGEGRRYEPPRTVVYEQAYRPAPAVVYQQPYRMVEQVGYYPVRGYGHHGWSGHERGWERHDEYRRDWDHRGGEHRGWDRHD